MNTFGFFFIRLFIPFFVLAGPSLSYSRNWDPEKPYKVRSGETLKKIAKKIYRHESWWINLRHWNPKLSKVGPDQRLRTGSIIMYAPNQESTECTSGIEQETRTPASKSNRFSVPQVYVTRSPENLKLIARRLYGHSDWWERILRENRHLKINSPDHDLPVGTRINYRAPKIGRVYIVQPSDSLTRIAQWKYGMLDEWEKVLTKNDRVEDPNLIYPGDCLILENNQIKNSTLGKVIMLRTPPPAPSPILANSGDPSGPPQRAPAAMPPISEGAISPFIWVLMGLAFTLGALFAWIFVRKGADTSDALGSIYGVKHIPGTPPGQKFRAGHLWLSAYTTLMKKSKKYIFRSRKKNHSEKPDWPL